MNSLYFSLFLTDGKSVKLVVQILPESVFLSIQPIKPWPQFPLPFWSSLVLRQPHYALRSQISYTRDNGREKGLAIWHRFLTYLYRFHSLHSNWLSWVVAVLVFFLSWVCFLCCSERIFLPILLLHPRDTFSGCFDSDVSPWISRGSSIQPVEPPESYQSKKKQKQIIIIFNSCSLCFTLVKMMTSQFAKK